MMKRTKTIEVTIDSSGGIKIDAMGYSGSSCEAATAFLEKALGMVETRSRKREFYGSASAARKVRHQDQQIIGDRGEGHEQDS